VRRVLGLVDSQLVVDLLRAIGERDRKGTLAIVDRAVDSGLDLEEFFLAYVEGLRNLLVLSVEGNEAADFLDLSQGEIAEFSGLGKAFRTEDLLYLFRAAARVYRDLKASGQPRYLLEAAFVEAASWESAVEVSELIRRLDSSGGPAVSGGPARERKADAGPSRPQRLESAAPVVSAAAAYCPAPAAPVEPAASVAPAAAPVVRTAEEDKVLRDLGGKEAWERFLSQIRETKLTLGIWLMSARVERFSENMLSLSFSPQNRFAREMVLEEKNRRFIEFHAERFFGRKVVIQASEHFESGAEEQKPVAEGAKTRAPKTQKPRAADPALDAIAGDAPVIKRLIEEFDGELFKEKS
jgi:DNA polymerase III gamma/tau subunit